MDITDTSPQRRQLGIERFTSGEESLVYDEVVFWREPEGSLIVTSYSDFVHLAHVTPEEAAQKIERSKRVLKQLRAESPEFEAAVAQLNHKFEFCYDYGKDAVKVAALEGDALRWFR